eukprot:m.71956 g.71956  ORF g.71956 m.71956 type:complete len:52 (+) comp12292_c1_seq2:668-823(+)
MAYARDMNSGGGIVIACEIILFQPCPVDSEKKHKGQPITGDLYAIGLMLLL